MAPPRTSARNDRYPNQRLVARAYQRAANELINRHRDEFEPLVDKHRTSLGLQPRASKRPERRNA